MADRPMYAALVSPDLSPDAELTFRTLLAGPVALALAGGGVTASQARVVILLRRVFEGAGSVKTHFIEKLDVTGAVLRAGTPEQAAAALWLQVQMYSETKDHPSAIRELTTAWSKVISEAGNAATGFGVRKARRLSGSKQATPRPNKRRLVTPPSVIVEEDGEVADTRHVIGPASDIGERVPPESEADREAALAWTSQVQAEMLLPVAWERFTDAELALLLDRLSSSASSVGIAIIQAALTCGLRPKAIAAALDGKKLKKNTCPFELRTVTGGTTVVRPITAKSLPKAFQPDPSDKHRYLASGAEIEISSAPIPVVKAAGYRAALELAVKDVRKDRRIRLTDGRVARQLACEYIRRSADPYAADLILRPDATSILSGSGYYIGVPIADALKALSFVEEMGGSLKGTGDILGSQGIPRLDLLSTSFAALAAKAQAALKDPSEEGIAEAHNSFTAWCLATLCLGSTHRLVGDPFPTIHSPVESRSLFVLQDKVSDASHSCRLAVASAVCKSQWSNYLKHLGALADRLHYFGSPDASRVRAASVGANESPPLFFFLDEDLRIVGLTPTSILGRLGADWSWHLSAHRHLLCWWLRNRGVPPEYVHAQLGHWTGGRAPFSDDSFLSPRELVCALSPHLDALNEHLGIRSMRGLLPAGVYGSRHNQARTYDSWGPLGPERRALERAKTEKKQLHVATTAREALSAAAWSFGIRSLSKGIGIIPNDVVDAAHDAIVTRYGEDGPSLTVALRALRTHCKALRNQGVKIRVPGAPYRPVSCSPLDDPSGKLAFLGTSIRDAVKAWLIEEAAVASPEEFPTLAFLSAVVNGGLIRSTQWKGFVLALGNRQHCRGIDWLELNTDDQGGDRYVGDAITRALIRKCDSEKIPTFGAIHAKANRLLNKACIDIAARLSSIRTGRAHLTLEQALPAIRDSLALDISGIALRHLEGKSGAQTTSSAHLQSLLSGEKRPCHAQAEVELASDSLQPPHVGTDDDLKLHITELQDALKRADADSAVAHGPSDRGRRLGERLAGLRDDLGTALVNQCKTGSHPALFRLTQYALQLAHGGGVQKDVLRPSTIRKYAGTRIEDFVRAFRGRDPVNLDSSERTRAYSELLNPPSSASPEFGDALRYFDWYVCEAHDLSPADWAMFGVSARPAHMKVFCDFPTHQELAGYLIEWKDVLIVGPFDVRRPLTVMTNCGLRTGEAYRLTGEDPLPGAIGAVRVRNKRTGETKSASGVRNCVNLQAIYSGDDSLEGNFAALPDTAIGNPILLGDDGSVTRHLLDVSLREALSAATGDIRVRPHLLRHAAVSISILDVAAGHSAVASKVLDGYFGKGRSGLRVAPHLTGFAHASVAAADGIATIFGHAEVSTSIEHYGHLMDMVCAAQLDETVGKVSSRFMAAVFDLAENVVNQRVYRRRKLLLDCSFPAILIDLHIDDHAPKQKQARKRKASAELTNRHLELPPREISVVDVAKVIELLHQGHDEHQIHALLGLAPDAVDALVASIDIIQTAFPPPLEWLQPSRIGTGTLTSKFFHAKKLFSINSPEVWEPTQDDVDALLASWRPSQRHFSVANETVRKIVSKWLVHARLVEGLNTSREGVLGFKELGTEQGTRLSLLLAYAYALAILQRALRRLSDRPMP